MSAIEHAVSFKCGEAMLQGIVTIPPDNQVAVSVGILIIVGGPQYRAGSHRQFVLLARHLAACGYPSMRFDYTGMGDSTGDPHDFLNVENDVSAALQIFMRQVPGLKKVALWGLCDGATAALLCLRHLDASQIAGVCLLNPWVRSEVSLARTHVKHYYLNRLRDRDFWLKLLSGKVASAAMVGLFQNLRLARRSTQASTEQTFQTRMAAALIDFEAPVLVILSGADYTAQEFIDYSAKDRHWQGVFQKENIDRHTVAEADHTFSNSKHRAAVETITATWLNDLIARQFKLFESC